MTASFAHEKLEHYAGHRKPHKGVFSGVESRRVLCGVVSLKQAAEENMTIKRPYIHALRSKDEELAAAVEGLRVGSITVSSLPTLCRLAKQRVAETLLAHAHCILSPAWR